MSRFVNELRSHKQLLVLFLWVCFLGVTIWQHTQYSQQPPIYDAYTYFQKAYNFWTEFHQLKPFNPFNVPPTIRPPGTVLMSYPFGFDADFRPFYFRSVFLPIVFICLAVVISGYHRKLDVQDKWNLLLVAVFVSVTPCLYLFEVSPKFTVPAFWGMVDGFLSGIAALAAAATVRSIFAKSLGWLALAAILSSLCLTIKPAGVFVMMSTGLTWFGFGIVKLMTLWNAEEQRTKALRWLAIGMIVLAIPYVATLAVCLSSGYISEQNRLYGNTVIAMMRNELVLSWSVLNDDIKLGGPGYAFIVWYVGMMTLVIHSFWRGFKDGVLSAKVEFVSSTIGASIALLLGIWFWLFGSAGANQTRYVIPFIFMAVVFTLPAILMVMREIHGRKFALLAGFMLIPSINMAILLPQQHPPLAWQLKTGVNLTSDSAETDPAYDQAKSFAREVKSEGRNIILYSFSRLPVDLFVQSTIDYWRLTKPPMPDVKIFRPLDWERPSTFHLDEMLAADYWLFDPMGNQEIQTVLNSYFLDPSATGLDKNDPIDKMLAGGRFNLFNEISLFEAWASQLTAKEGVSIVSQSPTLRLLRISNPLQLELALEAFVSKHRWSTAFLAANPKRKFSEQEMEAELVKNPPSLENINFGDRFTLRAVSTKRNGEEITVRIWWKPLSPITVSDWAFFIHFLDHKGDVLINKSIPIVKTSSPAALGNNFNYSELIFKYPTHGGDNRLGIGFNKPNQLIIADKGTRDMDGQRVIIQMP